MSEQTNPDKRKIVNQKDQNNSSSNLKSPTNPFGDTGSHKPEFMQALDRMQTIPSKKKKEVKEGPPVKMQELAPDAKLMPDTDKTPLETQFKGSETVPASAHATINKQKELATALTKAKEEAAYAKTPEGIAKKEALDKANLIKEASEAEARKKQYDYEVKTKQWKEDEARIAALDYVDPAFIEQAIKDEKDLNQFSDYAAGIAKGVANVGIGLLNLPAKGIYNLSGKTIPTDKLTIDPYKKGKDVKAFDRVEKEAAEEILQMEKDAKAAGQKWEYPTEAEVLKIKEDLFVKKIREEKIASNYREAFSPGYVYTAEGAARLKKTQERLELHKIKSIRNANDEQKINALIVQDRGSQMVKLNDILMHEKSVLDKKGATQEEVLAFNSKVEALRETEKAYLSSLKRQRDLDDKNLTTQDHLELFKLNYNPWDKLGSDLYSGIGKPIAGVTYMLDQEIGSDWLRKLDNKARKFTQYEMTKLNSVEDFGGYVTQTISGILPYTIAPHGGVVGAIAASGFAVGAAGERGFQMTEEMESTPGLVYSSEQRAAAMALSGVSNLVMQKGVANILKGASPVVGKAFADPYQKEAFRSGVKSFIESAIAKAPIAKNFLIETNKSGITGLGVGTIDMFADNVILGKKTDVKEHLIHMYSDFAVLHAAMHTIPATAGYGLGKLRSAHDSKKMSANYKLIEKLSLELDNPEISEETAASVEKQLLKAEADNDYIFNKGLNRQGLFTRSQTGTIFDIEQDKIDIKKRYEATLKDKSKLSPETFQETISSLEKEWNDAESRKAKEFEKTSALNYIKDASQLEQINKQALSSLEAEKANYPERNIKIDENAIKDRAAELYIYDTKLTENAGVEWANKLKDRAFKNLAKDVTDKQKEEGFKIENFDVVKEARRLFFKKLEFEESLKRSYSPESRSRMWEISEDNNNLRESIKAKREKGENTKEDQAILEKNIEEVIKLTAIAKEVEILDRSRPAALTKVENQIRILKKLTAEDIGQSNYEMPFGEGKAVEVFETEADAQAARDAYTAKYGLKPENMKSVDAEELPNGQTIIVKETAVANAQTNVGGHELMHKVLKGAFRNRSTEILREKLRELGALELFDKRADGTITKEETEQYYKLIGTKEFQDELAKVKEENKGHNDRINTLIESFKDSLSPEALAIIENRINKNYKRATKEDIQARKAYVDAIKIAEAEMAGKKATDPIVKKMKARIADLKGAVRDLNMIAGEGLNGKPEWHKTPDSYREEWLTLFSDGLVKGTIKDGIIVKAHGKYKINWDKIEWAVKQFSKETTGIEMEFKDSKDIVNFIRDYNKNFEKSRISSRAKGLIDAGIALGLSKGGSKKSKSIDAKRDFLEDELSANRISFEHYMDEMDKLDQQEIESIVEERPVTKTVAGEDSVRRKKNVTVDEKKLGNEIDSFVGPKNDKGKYTMTKAQWDKGGILKAKEKLIDGHMLEPLIRKELTRHGVSSDNVHGVPIDQFFEDVKNRILEAALLKFDPEKNNSLGGYIIGSQFGVKNRVGDVVNRYRNLLKTQSGDVEAGGVGHVSEYEHAMSEEVADFAFEEVSVEEGPKYKPLTELKLLEPEVLESIKDKTIRVLRTLKSKLQPPEQNVMVSPIVREIREEVGNQVDIDLKTAMGGKKDGELHRWLLKAKKGILENMTTTWLMGKDLGDYVQGGIPQAIQKRVDGEWLSYPEWVGQEIDRESTDVDLAGRTAGHEMSRRVPNVDEVVSVEEYLYQFLEPTGNPIRGRKESLAKALGAEIAFELINKDLKEGGPIYETLAKNQEMLNNALTDNAIEDILYQVERGNSKYSREIKEITDSELNKADREKIQELRQFSRQDMMDYVNNLSKEGLFDDARTYLLAGDKGKLAAENVTALDILRNNMINVAKVMVERKKTPKYGEDLHANGTYIHESNLAKIMKTYENNPEEATQEILNVVRSEYKAYMNSPASLESSSKQYFESFLKRVLDSDKNPELFGKDGFEIITEEVEVAEGKPDKLVNLYFRREKVDTRGRTTIKKRMLADERGHSKMIDVMNSEAEPNKQYMLDWAREAKTDKLFAEEIEGYMDMMAADPESALSKSHKVGLHVMGLKPAETTLDYNTPNDIIKRGIKDFIEGKISEEDLINMYSNSRVNLVDKAMENVLHSIKDKPSGEAKEYNDLFLAQLAPYIGEGKVKGLENMYDMDLLNAKLRVLEAIDPAAIEVEANLLDSLVFNTAGAKEKVSMGLIDFAEIEKALDVKIPYITADGKPGLLKGPKLIEKGVALLESGAKLDTNQIKEQLKGISNAKRDKVFELIREVGATNTYIQVEHNAASLPFIHRLLEAHGIELPNENIDIVEKPGAPSKIASVLAKAKDGYNNIELMRGSKPSDKDLAKFVEHVNFDSKQAESKRLFAEEMSGAFNKIIQDLKGIDKDETFSEVNARRVGGKKNRFDLYVPPSAADFELLLYNFMGKGKKGEAHKQFFEEALIKPYTNGVALMESARQSIKKDYKGLLKAFPEVAKDLGKLTTDGEFTYDQALRVAMWHESKIDIPGITEAEAIKLTEMVNGDPLLTSFKKGLVTLGRQAEGWLPPSEYWDSQSILTDLYNITEGGGRKKYLSEFIENSQAIFGKWNKGKLVGDNMNKIEAIYGTNVRESLEDSIYRMTKGKNRTYGQDKESSKWLNWVNNSTGTIMFLNTRSAALQLISTVNYINWKDNNPVAAAAAFANQPQYWSDVAHILNSDKLVERRSGLREDVSSSELANAAQGSKDKASAITAYLLKIGYTPTQIADSLAISLGGASFYRNRTKTYLKEGMELHEAEAKAWEDFSKTTDQTQQSGDAKDISKQQASGAGRLVLAFQNTSMQQARSVKKAYLDLKNRRGDDISNISKIGHYLVVQNIIFSSLQQGLFGLFFDDDADITPEEGINLDPTKEGVPMSEQDQKKQRAYINLANGVVDSILKGTGFVGGTVSVLKNMALKYLDEKDKGYKADYAKVVFEGANIAPPVGSKLKKGYSAFQTAKFEKDVMEKRGWDIMQDGRVHLSPKYHVLGKAVESATNIPLERLLSKIDNASEAMNAEHKSWQRVSSALGYAPYTVGIVNKGDQAIKAEAKGIRKEAGLKQSKITRLENKVALLDSVSNLSPKEYERYQQIEESKKKIASLERLAAKMEEEAALAAMSEDDDN